MNARPILFQAAMIQALLREVEKPGTGKTQTRRIMKPQPNCQPHLLVVRDRLSAMWGIRETHSNEVVPCPYGQPGDLLYVRETFQPIFAEGFEHGGDPAPDWETGFGYAPRYVATDGATEWIDGDDNCTSRCKPGIHMPRWASRLTLEITDVRVQRLQDISEQDAIAEGIEYDEDGEQRPNGHSDGGFYDYLSEDECADLEPIASFKSLWQLINGVDSWGANPRVWALTFKPHLVNVDEYLRQRGAA